MAAGAEEEEITDDDFLLRKIEDAPHLHPKPDGRRRISKAAFSGSSARDDPEQGMSCNSEALLAREEVDCGNFSPETPVLARLSVLELKKIGLEVVHRRLPGNYSHCNVLNVRDKHRKPLHRMAVIVRAPADVDKD